jgi:hypothetical protein
VGKLVAAFIMFLAASALAIHESRPSPPPPEEPVAVASRTEPLEVDHTPPSRAVHDEVPPWVKYATPTPPPPPKMVVTRIAPPVALVDPVSGEYLIDVVDRCPDQPNDRDDNDGCPEPERDRIILVE